VGGNLLLSAWLSWAEADTYEGEALEAFGPVDDLEAVSDALVHLGVGLEGRRVRKSGDSPACGTSQYQEGK